jgi:hypothetical protein
MRGYSLLVAVALLCLGKPAPAQSPDTSLILEQTSAQPSCCSVVRIDTAKSIVTAREIATGYTFRFAVKTRRVLRALRIGQPVWADFTSNTVKLKATDPTPCCGIVPPETP